MPIRPMISICTKQSTLLLFPVMLLLSLSATAQLQQLTISQTFYSSQGDTHTSLTYLYDSLGTPYRSIQSYLGRNDTIQILQPIHRQHPNGMEDTLFDPYHPQQLTQLIIRDIDGDETERHTFAPDGHLRHSRYTIYRAPATPSYSNTYCFLPEGTLYERRVTRYNAQGLTTQILFFTPDDVLTLRRTFHYDRHGNPVRIRSHYYDDGITRRKVTEAYRYTYDESGQWITRQHYLDNTLADYTVRTFRYR